jgi:hypothetical protein
VKLKPDLRVFTPEFWELMLTEVAQTILLKLEKIMRQDYTTLKAQGDQIILAVTSLSNAGKETKKHLNDANLANADLQSKLDGALADGAAKATQLAATAAALTSVSAQLTQAKADLATAQADAAAAGIPVDPAEDAAVVAVSSALAQVLQLAADTTTQIAASA